MPVTELPSQLKTDFSMMSQLDSDWLAVIGGEIKGANQGCGSIVSGESILFFKVGTRISLALFNKKMTLILVLVKILTD